jgi:pyruvate dehydrogenase (quinone)
MTDCDVLLMLGTDFPYRQFYPRGSGVRIGQVDLRAEVIGRRTPVDLAVIGDVRATIDALLPRLKEKRDGSHLDQAREHYRKARKGLDELARSASGKTSIHPQQIAKAISDLAAEDAVFTCDVGLPTVWAARYLAMNGKRRLIGSFWHGSMANAMPQAIGAQSAFPRRQVIALSGDGGFTMLMGDLLTLVQHRLPAKVVVFNNGALGFIELEQKSTGFLDFGTELKNPNSRQWRKRSVFAAFGSKTPPRSRTESPLPSRMTAPFSSMRSSTGQSLRCHPRSPSRWRRASRSTW